MEPTVEKDEFGEVVRSGIYTYGETVHIFVERKNYTGFSCQATREWIRLQPGTYWIKIYRSHGRKCGLERNEYLGKIYEEVMDL
jgi:4-hydroxyphenylpyruvate dioxygenase